MFDLMLNMRAIGKKGKQVFQKSVLMHISSLQLLFGDMKSIVTQGLLRIEVEAFSVN